MEPTEPERAQEPEQSDAVLPVTVGTALWAVSFIALLPFRSRLQADGTDWWLWVCLAGFGLGVLGSLWVRRRRAAYRRAAGSHRTARTR